MRTIIFTNNEIGDHVICTMCNETLLIDIGTETCPVCFKKGYLMWLSIINPERKLKDIQGTNNENSRSS